MRLMGLEAIYRAPRTSDLHPEHRVYPYLLKGMSINRSHQVGCADISVPQQPACRSRLQTTVRTFSQTVSCLRTNL